MNNNFTGIKTLLNILFFKKKDNKLKVQFFRYLVSSGIALIFYYMTYFIMTRILKVDEILSNIVGNTVGMLVNYIFNITWVFEKRKIENKIIEFLLFILTFILGTGLNTFIFWILTKILLIYDIISLIIATGITYIFRFVSRKIFLF